MKTLNKKEIEEMLNIWLTAYDTSDGMNLYNRETCVKLRKAGYSIGQLQDNIAAIKIKNRDKNKKLNAIETKVLEQHVNLDMESDICRNESLCDDVRGLKFLQSAQRGYTDKTAVEMNNNINLMDVISENTKNRKD